MYDTPHQTRAGRLLAAWLVLLCLTALVSTRAASAQTAQTLDAGAKIHVTVAGETDVSGDYTVDTAGNIQMLYVNQVHVAGLTTAQASSLLASKRQLGKYIKNPQVVVTLLSAGGINVEVTGAVATQGPRLVRSDARLNDVLQQAGPSLDADLGKVQITHGGPGETAHPQDTVNYSAFLNSQDSAGNPILRNNDVVFVPRKETQPINVSVRGQVAKPGRAVVPAKTTVYDAIQAAGGLLVDADRKGIAVQHANTTDQIAFDYDLALRQLDNAQTNPVLQDGDAVIVNAAPISNVYAITGAVRNPSEYPLPNTATSLEDAIGRAGGLSDRPKLKELTITRKVGKGGAETIKRDFSNPTDRARFAVLPGDSIYIPQGSPSRTIDPLTAISVLVGIFSVFRR